MYIIGKHEQALRIFIRMSRCLPFRCLIGFQKQLKQIGTSYQVNQLNSSYVNQTYMKAKSQRSELSSLLIQKRLTCTASLRGGGGGRSISTDTRINSQRVVVPYVAYTISTALGTHTDSTNLLLFGNMKQDSYQHIFIIYFRVGRLYQLI